MPPNFLKDQYHLYLIANLIATIGGVKKDPALKFCEQLIMYNKKNTIYTLNHDFKLIYYSSKYDTRIKVLQDSNHEFII